MTKFDHNIIDERARSLSIVSKTLKNEFYGLDLIIDRIISSINAWYTFPTLITRPVIINLWGLTGVGKTHLVRRLVELIEFNDRFVEIQMDVSTRKSTIASVLIESSIDQGSPGIILLDEFQRYRTIDYTGADVQVESFQDVWMLLSDGKFAADSSMFQEIEMIIASSEYHQNNKSNTEEKKKFSIYPYEARNIKRTLNLSHPVQEIMKWDEKRLSTELDKVLSNNVGVQLDFTKTLIFISGNLDEAFNASNVNDCDTDADVFHESSKKINVMDIKKALKSRFKPEQISRFGNNHIIYPSISKKSYQQIIHSACTRYINEMTNVTGIDFSLTPESEDVIYANSVYPTQGTRPVFSSVHTIFSDGLVQLAFWAIKHKINNVKISIDGQKSLMKGESSLKFQSFSMSLINKRKILQISS